MAKQSHLQNSHMELDLNKAKKKLYNKYCGKYEERTKDYARNYLQEDVDKFLQSLQGKLILDIGAGPGRDGKIFNEKGFRTICLDMSKGMLNLCREKGLEVVLANFEHLCFKQNSFDGIWAYTSLTTAPKATFQKILPSIHELLKSDGVFYIGMIEGEGEGWKPADGKYDMPRYATRYSPTELRQILRRNFSIVYSSVNPKEFNGRNTYLHFMCKK